MPPKQRQTIQGNTLPPPNPPKKRGRPPLKSKDLSPSKSRNPMLEALRIEGALTAQMAREILDASRDGVTRQTQFVLRHIALLAMDGNSKFDTLDLLYPGTRDQLRELGYTLTRKEELSKPWFGQPKIKSINYVVSW